jgi:ferredoxin
MINITNKQNCCGCSACATICPKRCITMAADNEGFLYPQVNKNICIDCGLCEKVCNELHPFDKRKPLKTLAIINNNERIRLKSSSGGVFHILAEKTINERGVVFGARFDKN